MSEQTVKCNSCGNPYVIYAMYVGDQSVCGSCRTETKLPIGTQTAMCGICGKSYITYSYYAGDQSACPGCREKARSR